jgi:hypothetical protein
VVKGQWFWMCDHLAADVRSTPATNAELPCILNCPANSTEFRLARVPADRTVIVQPHIIKRVRKKADAAKHGINRLRLNQLNTLLANAWLSAQLRRRSWALL